MTSSATEAWRGKIRQVPVSRNVAYEKSLSGNVRDDTREVESEQDIRQGSQG